MIIIIIIMGETTYLPTSIIDNSNINNNYYYNNNNNNNNNGRNNSQAKQLTGETTHLIRAKRPTHKTRAKRLGAKRPGETTRILLYECHSCPECSACSGWVPQVYQTHIQPCCNELAFTATHSVSGYCCKFNKDIVLNTGIFWLFRTCSASFDHLIGEKTRMYFAKSLSDSIMNSYSLLPNITILIMQSTSMALLRI